jgi:uncharacterized protein (DUF4415 family)
MTENKRGIATDLKALDAHVIKPDEYEDAPELTDEQLAKAVVRRGRPPLENRKQPVKIRLDRDVVKALRASGPGWQTRVNAALRKAVLKANQGLKVNRGTLMAPKVPRVPTLKTVRATAKRRKDDARQRPKKADLKKAIGALGRPSE